MQDVNWIKLVCQLIGGLGLFLYGMKLMSEGLQKSAGASLRRILERLTSNRILGAFVGLLVTAVIQSSSATTVMVVGFVNAGLMNLAQALSVVLGANVGTTITGQLIAFKVGQLALPAIGIGVFLRLFSKNPRMHYYGEVMVGFGLLFLGLAEMKHSFVPLKKSLWFTEAFVYFSANPIMAAVAGALLTMIVQSSSATLGITIALASTGIIDFYAASALVLGENIGTTITANIAAIGANKAAKRAALGHFLFNAIGVTYMLLFLKFFTGIVDGMTPGDPNFVGADGNLPYIARHIANVHTLFNIINTLMFLPVLGYLATLCERIIGGDDDKQGKLLYLSENLIDTPDMAVSQAHKEVERMGDMALEMLETSRKAFFDRDLKYVNRVYELEVTVDSLEKDITNYLVKLYQQPISEQNSKTINAMMHVIYDIEKIGDYAESIARYSEKMVQDRITFSASAKKDLEEMFEVAIRFTRHIFDAWNRGKSYDQVDTSDENLLDQMKIQYKNHHMARLNQGVCNVDNGILYVDILNKLEKAGDNAFNIAQAIQGEIF